MTHRALRSDRANAWIRAAVHAEIEQLENRRMLSAAPAGVWVIKGTARPDDIVVQLSPTNANRIQAVVNGRVAATRWRSQVAGIRVNAGTGDDSISIDLPESDDQIETTLNGGSGDDTLDGGFGDDDLYGGSGEDEIDGGMGDDQLDGGTGNDLLTGEEGSDDLEGGIGNDTLAGGMGDDDLSGDSGNDQLSGGWGEDDLDGDVGNDTLRGGDGKDSLDGNAGRDVIYHEKQDYWHFSRYDISRNDQRTNPLRQVQDTTTLKNWLINQAMAQWKWAFGQPTYYWWRPLATAGGSGMVLDGAGTGDMPAAAPGAIDAPTHSNTNVQVEGVDEADIVKTDGNWLYLLHDNQLIIMDAWPAEQTHIVSTTQLSGWSNNLYLDGDRLTVISHRWVNDITPYPPVVNEPGTETLTGTAAKTSGSTGNVDAGLAVEPAVIAMPISGSFMPIMWDWAGKSQTIVTVYDISDRKAPRVVSETKLDGSISDSRDIAGREYLVLNNNLQMPRPQIIADSTTGDYVYESADSYRARLEAMSIDDLMPHYTTTITQPDGTTQEVTGSLISGDLYVPASDRDPNNIFSVVLINATDEAPQPIKTTSVVGFSGTIYVSQNNMYVTAQHWDSPIGDWNGDYQTDIYKFNLGTDAITLAATGEVPGWTVNQFAMDENTTSGTDYFRIATTSETDGRSNNVFVMKEVGDSLQMTGSITELALGERIYAARFMGDRAFLVTFRQTDPLFTLDMSNPESDPQLKGVLEMPGYSSYLHPVGQDLLIGFGRDADENGRVNGLKVSLFNVKDMTDPQLVATYKLPMSDVAWNWNSSQAEWDHHAFSYFADQHVLALPVLDSGWWNGDAKLLMLKVDEKTGFTELGEIAHDGQVLRSVEIGDFVYSIGTDAVKVVDIADPTHEEASVPFDTSDPSPGEPGIDPVPMPMWA